jgi:hypothetical protein
MAEIERNSNVYFWPGQRKSPAALFDNWFIPNSEIGSARVPGSEFDFRIAKAGLKQTISA